MKLADFNLLKKLCVMTESPNDAEALTAIRKANALLKVNDVNWDRVFKRLVTVDVEAANSFNGDEAIDDAVFEIALCNAKGDGHRKVLASIYAQWQRSGAITSKQRGVVLRAVANA